jgi:hypothetical protein
MRRLSPLDECGRVVVSSSPCMGFRGYPIDHTQSVYLLVLLEYLLVINISIYWYALI